MGLLFGARLNPHADVILIGRWPDQIAALRAGPLQVITPGQRTRRIALHATDDLRTVGPVELALIVTKTPRTAAAAADAAQVLAPDGLAISLQNGLGSDVILTGVLGVERVTRGVTTLGASTRGQAGRLYPGGEGTTTLATRPAIDARLRAIAALFQRAGLDTQLTTDINALIWGKLAINAAINPISAILRLPNGALLESGWTRDLMRQAAYEVAAVAAAQAITLPFEDAAAQAIEVARQTAYNQSSMLQDVQRGAPTEIDAICGAVVRAGAEHDVPTPVNRTLYELVKALEVSGGLQADGLQALLMGRGTFNQDWQTR
jgi:2-dehydropantoate 2-reductase